MKIKVGLFQAEADCLMVPRKGAQVHVVLVQDTGKLSIAVTRSGDWCRVPFWQRTVAVDATQVGPPDAVHAAAAALLTVLPLQLELVDRIPPELRARLTPQATLHVLLDKRSLTEFPDKLLVAIYLELP